MIIGLSPGSLPQLKIIAEKEPAKDWKEAFSILEERPYFAPTYVKTLFVWKNSSVNFHSTTTLLLWKIDKMSWRGKIPVTLRNPEYTEWDLGFDNDFSMPPMLWCLVDHWRPSLRILQLEWCHLAAKRCRIYHRRWLLLGFCHRYTSSGYWSEISRNQCSCFQDCSL